MHVFTSPHLINITERIQIAGKEISKKYFEFLLAECIKINDREELSFFELITAVAFLAFSKNISFYDPHIPNGIEKVYGIIFFIDLNLD